MRFADGSAGDANYTVIGARYTRYRQPLGAHCRTLASLNQHSFGR
jgi:hypothetical protein